MTLNLHTGKRPRTLLVLAVAMSMMLSLANLPTQQAQAASHASKVIVVGSIADIDKLDPQIATKFTTIGVLGLVYSSLVESDATLKIVPALAQSWKFSAGGTQLRMVLRPGVKFHDGTSFTAADAKASLERIMDPKVGAAARASLATVSSIVAAGLNLTINLSVPNVPLLAALDGVNMSMLSRKDIAAGLVGKEVNGTGPFKFVSWKSGQSVKLVTNKTYFKGAPKTGGVTFRVIPSEASLLSALKANTIDFAVIGDPLIARRVGKNLSLFKTPALAYHVLQLNARRAPLDNVNVRLAIQCAIDRQEVVNTAALGEGQITGPLTMPLYRTDVKKRPCPVANIAKAKKYLADGGYPNGITIKTMVTSGYYALAQPIAESLKAQLAKAGITLELENLDAATYIPRWLAADFTAAVANNGGRVDPDTMYTRYFTSTGNLNKVAGYSSATLDANFLRGKAVGNVLARQEIYKAISSELENRAVWVWLFTPYNYIATSKKLQGFVPIPTGSLLGLRSAFFASN